jgi:predicted nucleotidyltransferase
MRLTNFEKKSIKESFLETFKRGKIYLFGSRTDDNRRGGDIDLYILLDYKESADTLFNKKIEFLGKLQNKIGEQKIDVIISKDKKRAIEQEALKRGIEL